MRLPQDPEVKMADGFHISGCGYIQGTLHRYVTLYREEDEVPRDFMDRLFAKALTLKDVKDRNAQFEKIHSVLEEYDAADILVLSIDTKKK